MDELLSRAENRREPLLGKPEQPPRPFVPFVPDLRRVRPLPEEDFWDRVARTLTAFAHGAVEGTPEAAWDALVSLFGEEGEAAPEGWQPLFDEAPPELQPFWPELAGAETPQEFDERVADLRRRLQRRAEDMAYAPSAYVLGQFANVGNLAATAVASVVPGGLAVRVGAGVGTAVVDDLVFQSRDLAEYAPEGTLLAAAFGLPMAGVGALARLAPHAQIVQRVGQAAKVAATGTAEAARRAARWAKSRELYQRAPEIARDISELARITVARAKGLGEGGLSGAADRAKGAATDAAAKAKETASTLRRRVQDEGLGPVLREAWQKVARALEKAKDGSAEGLAAARKGVREALRRVDEETAKRAPGFRDAVSDITRSLTDLARRAGSAAKDAVLREDTAPYLGEAGERMLRRIHDALGTKVVLEDAPVDGEDAARALLALHPDADRLLVVAPLPDEPFRGGTLKGAVFTEIERGPDGPLLRTWKRLRPDDPIAAELAKLEAEARRVERGAGKRAAREEEIWLSRSEWIDTQRRREVTWWVESKGAEHGLALAEGRNATRFAGGSKLLEALYGGRYEAEAVARWQGRMLREYGQLVLFLPRAQISNPETLAREIARRFRTREPYAQARKAGVRQVVAVGIDDAGRTEIKRFAVRWGEDGKPSFEERGGWFHHFELPAQDFRHLAAHLEARARELKRFVAAKRYEEEAGARGRPVFRDEKGQPIREHTEYTPKAFAEGEPAWYRDLKTALPFLEGRRFVLTFDGERHLDAALHAARDRRSLVVAVDRRSDEWRLTVHDVRGRRVSGPHRVPRDDLGDSDIDDGAFARFVAKLAERTREPGGKERGTSPDRVQDGADLRALDVLGGAPPDAFIGAPFEPEALYVAFSEDAVRAWFERHGDLRTVPSAMRLARAAAERRPIVVAREHPLARRWLSRMGYVETRPMLWEPRDGVEHAAAFVQVEGRTLPARAVRVSRSGVEASVPLDGAESLREYVSLREAAFTGRLLYAKGDPRRVLEPAAKKLGSYAEAAHRLAMAFPAFRFVAGVERNGTKLTVRYLDLENARPGRPNRILFRKAELELPEELAGAEHPAIARFVLKELERRHAEPGKVPAEHVEAPGAKPKEPQPSDRPVGYEARSANGIELRVPLTAALDVRERAQLRRAAFTGPLVYVKGKGEAKALFAALKEKKESLAATVRRVAEAFPDLRFVAEVKREKGKLVVRYVDLDAYRAGEKRFKTATVRLRLPEELLDAPHEAHAHFVLRELESRHPKPDAPERPVPERAPEPEPQKAPEAEAQAEPRPDPDARADLEPDAGGVDPKVELDPTLHPKPEPEQAARRVEEAVAAADGKTPEPAPEQLTEPSEPEPPGAGGGGGGGQEPPEPPAAPGAPSGGGPRRHDPPKVSAEEFMEAVEREWGPLGAEWAAKLGATPFLRLIGSTFAGARKIAWEIADGIGLAPVAVRLGIPVPVSVETRMRMRWAKWADVERTLLREWILSRGMHPEKLSAKDRAKLFLSKLAPERLGEGTYAHFRRKVAEAIIDGVREDTPVGRAADALRRMFSETGKEALDLGLFENAERVGETILATEIARIEQWVARGSKVPLVLDLDKPALEGVLDKRWRAKLTIDSPEVAENTKAVLLKAGAELRALRLRRSGRLEKAIARGDYWPRVWRLDRVLAEQERLVEILRRHLTERRGLPPEEAEFEAKRIVQRIVEEREYVRQGDDDTGYAGSLHSRLLWDLPNAEVKDFIELDPAVTARRYFQQVWADIELTRSFGGPNMKPAIIALERAMREHTAELVRKAPEAEREALRKKLDAEISQVLADVRALRDRLRGALHLVEDPYALHWRGARALRTVNSMLYLGMAPISAVVDLARPIMVHGLRPALEVPWKLFRANMDPALEAAAKEALEEIERAGAALESVLAERAYAFSSSFDPLGTRTAFERGLATAEGLYFKALGLLQWTDVMKKWAGLVVQDRLVRNVLKGWDALTDREREFLLQHHISASDVERIAAELKKHGKEEGGLWLARPQLWDDPDLALRWRAAILDDVNTVIVTPGVGDTPTFMSHEAAKLLLQFKTFAMASTWRVMAAGLSRPDAHFVVGATLSVALGMTSLWLKEALKGYDYGLDFEDYLWLGVERSGVLGALPDVHTYAAALLGQGIDDVLGVGWPWRPDLRFRVQQLLGPSAQTLSNIYRVVTLNDPRGRALTKLIPANNVWYLHRLFHTPYRRRRDEKRGRPAA